PISYKNGYRSSSWVSLMQDRIGLGRELLRCEDGVLCCTIDDYQQKELSFLMHGHFGQEGIAGTVAIRMNPSGRPVPTGFGQAHEYGIFALRNPAAPLDLMPRSEDQLKRYKEHDDQGRYMWELFRKRGSGSERTDRPTLYYPLLFDGKSLRVPTMEWDSKQRVWNINESPKDGETELWPIDQNGVERRWRWRPDAIMKDPSQFTARMEDGISTVYYKYRPREEGVLPLTIWSSAKYSATEHGTGLLKHYFREYSAFSYPKSIHAVIDSIRISGMTRPQTICLDYFAGSGTTGHAVININREDSGNRKYILVEMGEYFDTVLKPRIAKVVYSTDWKDGKPQSRNTGISHMVKYIRLESYEDTLNNLHVTERGQYSELLENGVEREFREGYMLGYMLDWEAGAAGLSVDAFRKPFDY
ncbi:MAG: site-specific DNA-methyltransferase, partial [Spirochaetaceae bacterium]|nr:site-specific DNA-methyltransferase [Spirochaetaceae bacterium]